jgi:hydrophobe/amphiphile efflux-1 (HAE1) family protein
VRLPQYFIDRPIFAAVLSIVITLIGVVSMFRLPISEYPEVVPPTIGINATYPGASPETIAATVAGPLEQQMTGLDGLIYLGSQSMPDGSMQLTLTFRIGTNLDAVLTDVQNRVQIASPRLPEEVRRLGVVAQKATRDLLLVVNLDSPDGSMDTLTLANYARLNVRDQLLRIPGVRDVRVFGSGEYAMRVWLDPERMAARSLTPSGVVQAIREQNLQVTAGIVGQQPVSSSTGFEMTVTSQERLADEQSFRNIIVTRGAGGQLVRLSDVARVELGGNSYSMRGLLSSRGHDGAPDAINKTAVALPIIQAPGSNALEVATKARATIAELAKSFPPGIRQQVIYDPTIFISESIRSVVHTLIEAIILVVLVVILFLQTWRASLIPLLAVPVSIIGTFAVMQAMGFSINALSLFGLVLSIGIVVDDAIVVVENVERNIALGLAPRAASKQAMREVSGPILATALVLCSVFIPTAFISGLTGRFFQQFALTIAISTAISAFNSLTLSPALAALLLKPHVPGQRPGGILFGWFFSLFNRFFGAASSGYVGVARRTVRFSIISLLIYGGLLFMTYKMFAITPTNYIPQQDKGYMIAMAQLPDGASLDRSEAVVKRMGEIAMQHPAVDGVVQFPGLSINGFTPASNAGVAFIRLKSWDERQAPGMSDIAVAKALAGPFAGIEDGLVRVFPPPPVLGLGTTGGIKLYLEDRGSVGLPQLYAAVQATLAGARKRPEINPMATYSSASMGVPRIAVDIDRDKAVTVGVRPTEIYDALQGYFGVIYANDFNRFGRTWQVNVQADAPFRLDQADFNRLKVRNNVGVMVPLASFVTIRETAGPDRATQYNTYSAIDINVSPAPGYTSDQAKAAMEAVMKETLPREIAFEWTELTYQQIIAGNTAFYVFPVCILLVLLVLAAFYESLVLPLAIVLIVPMCLLCALGGIWLMGGDNNIMTQIGLVVLVGLACKNAILIVEFAREAEIHQGMNPLEAAMEACRLRLRPILMTSIAFIMGVFPLMTAIGAGAELRKATGTAVFFGMIGVTVFGLLLTPVFYVVLRRLTGGHLHKADEEVEDAD